MSTRKLLFRLLPLLVIALLVPIPAAAASSASTDFVGTLELIHGEDFDTGVATYDYHLQVGRDRVKVKFHGEAPDGFVNGAIVRIHGRRDGGTITAAAATVAADGTTSTQVLASAPGWTGQRKLAVILVNFTNNATKPFTRAYANGVVFTNANSVRAYYAEQSHGAMVLTGTTFDWVKVPLANSSCLFSEWATAAKAGLAARGVDLSSYTNFMYIFPPTSSCSWGGLGYLPGSSTWINGTPHLRIPAHELGHNLGVHHASSLRCTSNGVRVALSSTCTKSEYGDPFTTMGKASTRHVSNLSLTQIGYLPVEASKLIVASGSYALGSAASSSGVRILAVPRGDGTFFYLEYRRPYGTYFDNFSTTNPVVKGVTIRLAKGWTTITQTLLIDTIPSTTTFTDAPLRLTKTFKDYKSGLTIYVSALTTTTATVKITLGPDTIAPTIPGAFTATATSTSAVALAWTAATDNRAVAGYRIWRDGVLITTTSATARTLADTGLKPGTTYAYTIRAIDGAGNQGPAAAVSIITPQPDAAPSAPGSLAATVGTTTARLTWTAATDNLGVTGYRVWRDGALSGTTSGLSFNVTGLTAGTTYEWTVRAVDTAGQLGAPASASATTAQLDTTPPTAPVATITRANGQWSDLSWSAAEDNVGVTGYEIYRNGSLYASTGSASRTARVPATGDYTVVAMDAQGNRSEPSQVVSLG